MKSVHVAFNISHLLKNTRTKRTLNIGCLNTTSHTEKKVKKKKHLFAIVCQKLT